MIYIGLTRRMLLLYKKKCTLLSKRMNAQTQVHFPETIRSPTLLPFPPSSSVPPRAASHPDRRSLRFAPGRFLEQIIQLLQPKPLGVVDGGDEPLPQGLLVGVLGNQQVVETGVRGGQPVVIRPVFTDDKREVTQPFDQGRVSVYTTNTSALNFKV